MNLTRILQRSEPNPDLDYPNWVVAIMLAAIALLLICSYKLIDLWSQWR